MLTSLLDAGLLFLLRFALDDSVEGVMSAAVRALRALLVSTEDEVRFQLGIFYSTCSVQRNNFLFVLHSEVFFKHREHTVYKVGEKKTNLDLGLCCVGESGQHVFLAAGDGSFPFDSPGSQGGG